MPVPVMKVGVVDVLMSRRRVRVPVRVRLGDRPVVLMLMVFVVHVAMLVLHRRVEMLVLVSLRQVQPKTNTHQQPRADQRHCHWIMQQGDCDDGADERREREVSPGPCSSEAPQGRHEQDQADAHAEKSDDDRPGYRGARWHSRAPRQGNAEVNASSG
jgi:hypothetical protein